MNIWLIDDDSMTNLIHEAVIRKFDPSIETVVFEFPVVAFTTLEQNLALLPDLILLDLNMPEMNGWQFIEAFEPLGLEVPICVVSSSIDELDRQKALSYDSVRAYFTKPLKVPKMECILSHAQQIPLESPLN